VTPGGRADAACAVDAAQQRMKIDREGIGAARLRSAAQGNSYGRKLHLHS
jgi:hypothetical protein